jgi:hypothetical protein
MKKTSSFLVFVSLLVYGFFAHFNLSFAAVHLAGANVSNNGTVYMITDDGQRRPYTSAGAFLSYGFNSWTNVQQASTEDLALPVGSFIPPRDGKIICSDRGTDKGTCYLMTNGKPAAFVSAQVFYGLGFSFSKDLTGDVSFLTQDTNITNSTDQHRLGVLVKKSGSLYIVGPTGLLPVPSTAVLTSWGYSAGDAVTANAADLALPQGTSISARQGAVLSPIGSSSSSTSANTPASSGISEDSLVQGYLDTYPDLPTTTISAPDDAGQVLDLVKTMDGINSSSLDPFFPYLSAKSVEFLNKAPNFKSYWETDIGGLADMSLLSSDVKVFTGGTFALYTESKKQDETNYVSNNHLVFLKENGVWKWDLIGTIKYGDEILTQRNPLDLYTTGTGINDIELANVNFVSNIAPPIVNYKNTWLLIPLQNTGQTTIEKFHLLVKINTFVVEDQVFNYEILPFQKLKLYVPIDTYWNYSSAKKTAGTYTTEVSVGFDASVVESNTLNNSYKFDTFFNDNNAPTMGSSQVQ